MKQPQTSPQVAAYFNNGKDTIANIVDKKDFTSIFAIAKETISLDFGQINDPEYSRLLQGLLSFSLWVEGYLRNNNLQGWLEQCNNIKNALPKIISKNWPLNKKIFAFFYHYTPQTFLEKFS